MRDVRAGDEEQESHRAQQRQQHRPHVAKEVVGKRRGGGREVQAGRIVLRHLGSEPLGQRRDLRGCLLTRDARFQPRHPGQEVRAANRHRRAVEPERDERVGGQRRVEVPGNPERRRHHADHGEGLPVEHDAAADDVGVGAEAPPPQAVAEQDHQVAVGGVFLGCEETSELRRHTEGGQHAVRYDAERNPHRLSGTRQGHRLTGRNAEVFERSELFAVVEVLQGRDRGTRRFGPAVPDADEPLGTLVGSGRRTTASRTEKMAALAPMPSARVTAAPSAKAGDRRSDRAAERTSCHRMSRMELRPWLPPSTLRPRVRRTGGSSARRARHSVRRASPCRWWRRPGAAP